MVMTSDGSTFPVTNYQWNTTACYTHPDHNSGNPTCFPTNQTTQSVTGNDLTAEDAGTITCTVTIGGVDFTSEPLTLRISGMLMCVRIAEILHVLVNPGFQKVLKSWGILYTACSYT